MLTPDQADALAKARESALRLKRFADKARSLGLPVMESYLREASVNCQMAADFQEAQGLPGFLPHAEAKTHDWVKQCRALGWKCDTCGMDDANCSCPGNAEANARAIADTMKRRGLV